jgi:hypothetical protein
MAATTSAAQPSDPTAVQNRQEQKQAFVANGADGATRNPGSLQVPASPYEVMAGTIIPAALVTRTNSDLLADCRDTFRDKRGDICHGLVRSCQLAHAGQEDMRQPLPDIDVGVDTCLSGPSRKAHRVVKEQLVSAHLQTQRRKAPELGKQRRCLRVGRVVAA